jgi:PAS domain S-box-containing protein
MPHLSEPPSRELLALAHPFYMRVSEELRVTEVGPSLARIRPELLGQPVDAAFTILRPVAGPASAELLRQCQGHLAVLQLRDGLSLQAMTLGHKSEHFLLAMPIIQTFEEAKSLGLTMSDFPVSGFVGEFLQVRREEQAHADAFNRVSHELNRMQHAVRHIADAVSDIIFIINRDGTWRYLNKAWTTATGILVEDALRRPIFDFLDPDHLIGINAILEHPGRLLHRRVLRLRCRNGRTRPFYMAATWIPGRSSTGSEEIIGTLLDVSQETRITRALQEKNSRLEADNEQAEAAVAEKDWLATMSHEFRTPLHVITGAADFLRTMTLPPRQSALVTTISTNASYLAHLAQSFLALEELDTAQFVLREEPFSPVQLLESLSDVAQLRAKQGQVSVITNPPSPGCPESVIADAGRIRQVLYNLASNAAKFVQRGTITLTFWHEMHSSSAGSLHFSVDDTGPGITSREQSRVFSRGFRSSASETQEGTGLGLFISKRITDALGGTLTFKSTEGIGTSFHASFPFSLPRLALPPQPGIQPLEWTRPPRVLLVEDFAPSLELGLLMLNSSGCHTEGCPTGTAAVSLATQKAFDLILMDMQLPDISGLEAVTRIRQTESRLALSRTAIVMLTAHAETGLKQSCLSSGADDFLLKPATKNILVDCIRQLADLRPTVIVADGSPDTRASIVAALGPRNLRIIQAGSGLDTLKQLEREQIDAVILGSDMPELNGPDTVTRIRGSERWKHLPVLPLAGGLVPWVPGSTWRPGDNTAAVIGRDAGSLLTAIDRVLAPSQKKRHTTNDRVFDKLVQDFLHTSSSGLLSCRDSLDHNAFNDITKVAHQLKGAGTAFGFPDITHMARELEDAAQNTDTPRVTSAIAQLLTITNEALHGAP